jgi:hypothetical protein
MHAQILHARASCTSHTPSSTRTTVAAPLNAAKPPLEDLDRRSSSFALGRAAARPRCPRCRWRGVIATRVRRLPSQCCIPGLVPTAADRRAQRGEAAVHRRKLGVGSHCHAHFPAKVKRSPPTKVASADATRRRFVRKKERFVPNSRACRRQLLLWRTGAVKSQPVTYKRGRRRRDMGRAPVGPVRSMRNTSTDQGVSSRGQPVQTNTRQQPIAWPRHSPCMHSKARSTPVGFPNLIFLTINRRRAQLHRRTR